MVAALRPPTHKALILKEGNGGELERWVGVELERVVVGDIADPVIVSQ